MKRWLVRIALSALVGYAIFFIATYAYWGDFSLSELNFSSLEIRDTPTSSAPFEHRAGVSGLLGVALCSWSGLWEWFFGDWF